MVCNYARQYLSVNNESLLLAMTYVFYGEYGRILGPFIINGNFNDEVDDAYKSRCGNNVLSCPSK
ncbi:hypothetical protein GCM10022405_11330 [Gibbsiella dentisursi]|uniref:Uncharacterized protein n=1 Tax=Gibbsiella dentisursi TaxID=796890 RepID=A0ABP7KW42_9GAMM